MRGYNRFFFDRPGRPAIGKSFSHHQLKGPGGWLAKFSGVSSCRAVGISQNCFTLRPGSGQIMVAELPAVASQEEQICQTNSRECWNNEAAGASDQGANPEKQRRFIMG